MKFDDYVNLIASGVLRIRVVGGLGLFAFEFQKGGRIGFRRAVLMDISALGRPPGGNGPHRPSSTFLVHCTISRGQRARPMVEWEWVDGWRDT